MIHYDKNYFINQRLLTYPKLPTIYKLPLRQCEGFINSIFTLMELQISSPGYSCLSKRLSSLNIKSPRYKKSNSPRESVVALAIDSSGLKQFGRDEWHQEKHNVSAKRSWRKVHIVVDDHHIIHGSTLTDRFISDDQAVDTVLKQIDVDVAKFTADGAYDKNSVYDLLSEKFPSVEIIIPPDSDAIYSKHSHPQRNRNLQEIKTFGRMNWQRVRQYGYRNYSELCIQRYKKIFGNKLQAREFSRQKNEVVIGCGVLNKITHLGMPSSYKTA